MYEDFEFLMQLLNTSLVNFEWRAKKGNQINYFKLIQILREIKQKIEERENIGLYRTQDFENFCDAIDMFAEKYNL